MTEETKQAPKKSRSVKAPVKGRKPNTGVVVRKATALQRAVVANPRVEMAAEFCELQSDEEPLTEDDTIDVPSVVGKPVTLSSDDVKGVTLRGFREGAKDIAIASMASAIDTLRAKKAAAEAALNKDGIPE